MIRGVVRDLYMGAPEEDVFIHYMDSETMMSIVCVEPDDQGRYSVVEWPREPTM